MYIQTKCQCFWVFLFSPVVASKGHLWSVCMYLNRWSVKERSFSWWLQRKEQQEQRGVPLMFSLQTAPLHSSWQIESNGKRGGGITKTKAGIGCWFRVGENAAIVVKWGNARVFELYSLHVFWSHYPIHVVISLKGFQQLFAASLFEVSTMTLLKVHHTLKVFHVYLQIRITTLNAFWQESV